MLHVYQQILTTRLPRQGTKATLFFACPVTSVSLTGGESIESLVNAPDTRPRLLWPRHRRSCCPALCRISTAGRRLQRNWRCTCPAVRYPMSLSATCHSRPRLSQTNRVKSDDVWMTIRDERVEQTFWSHRLGTKSVWPLLCCVIKIEIV